MARAREAHALFHAAGQLLRIRFLESFEANCIHDAAHAPLGRLDKPAATFWCTVSQGKSAKFWKTSPAEGFNPVCSLPQ
jgi:hypothetical protein